MSQSVAGAPTGQPHRERSLAMKREVTRYPRTVETRDGDTMHGYARDLLAADDAYLAAHPEHVAPEVVAAVLRLHRAEIEAAARSDALAPILAEMERWGLAESRFASMKELNADLLRAAGVEPTATRSAEGATKPNEENR